jgi:hypothetical protein
MIPDQGKWVKIADFAGENGKNTPPFNITERRWRITWICKKLAGSAVTTLTVTAKPDDTKPNLQDVCDTDHDSTDTTEMRGEGAYFFHVISKCRWALSVEQYVPTDLEREVIAARDEHDQNWQILGNYSGIGERDTDTFTPTLARWRVKWFSEAPSGWPEDSLSFHVSIFKQDGHMMAELCNASKAGHDVVEFSGIGSYYFKVTGQAKWTLVVQQTDK